MQAKHQSLLKRVDTLYEECEELQGLLGVCEDKQAELLNQLKLTTEEKEQVRAQLSEQQVDGKAFPMQSLSSVFQRGGLYVNASAPQGLCLKLQKEKQTLQADISQLRSSLADLKECVQALQAKERLLASAKLNPLPTMRQSRNTSFGKAVTCNAHSG